MHRNRPDRQITHLWHAKITVVISGCRRIIKSILIDRKTASKDGPMKRFFIVRHAIHV